MDTPEFGSSKAAREGLKGSVDSVVFHKAIPLLGRHRPIGATCWTRNANRSRRLVSPLVVRTGQNAIPGVRV